MRDDHSYVVVSSDGHETFREEFDTRRHAEEYAAEYRANGHQAHVEVADYDRLMREQQADAVWQRNMRAIDREGRIAERKREKRAARRSLLWTVPLGVAADGVAADQWVVLCHFRSTTAILADGVKAMSFQVFTTREAAERQAERMRARFGDTTYRVVTLAAARKELGM